MKKMSELTRHRAYEIQGNLNVSDVGFEKLTFDMSTHSCVNFAIKF